MHSSSNAVYQGFAYRCNGNEASLASCVQTIAYVKDEYGIAMDCRGAQQAKPHQLP